MASIYSAKTAITRKKLSAPMAWLIANRAINGPSLDYGCGKGFDADYLGMDSYDPHFRPDFDKVALRSLKLGGYDTITCIYVLNVIEDFTERWAVEEMIKALLKPGVTAYFAVRNDKSKLKGATSRGTWQGHIVMDHPVVHTTPRYVIYKFTK